MTVSPDIVPSDGVGTDDCPDCAAQVERHHRALRAAAALFAELESRPVRRPGWDRARLACYLVAVSAYGGPPAVAVGAVVWFALQPDPLTAVVAVVGLLFLWVVRPRRQRPVRRGRLLARTEAPALYALADRVADGVGARRVDQIRVTGEIEVFHYTAGLYGRPGLIIGLPVWSVLTPDQRVALLAVLLAGDVDGSTRQHGLVGLALDSLAAWHGGLVLGARYAIGVPVPRVVATLPAALMHVLQRLSAGSNQHGTYWADAKAAELASSTAVAEMFDRLVLMRPLSHALRRAARRGERHPEWLGECAEVFAMAEEERERRRRLSVHAGVDLYTANPPAGLRRRMVLSRPAVVASMVPSAAEFEQIDAELRSEWEHVRRAVASWSP
jgi:hypothetical protein